MLRCISRTVGYILSNSTQPRNHMVVWYCVTNGLTFASGEFRGTFIKRVDVTYPVTFSDYASCTKCGRTQLRLIGKQKFAHVKIWKPRRLLVGKYRTKLIEKLFACLPTFCDEKIKSFSFAVWEFFLWILSFSSFDFYFVPTNAGHRVRKLENSSGISKFPSRTFHSIDSCINIEMINEITANLIHDDYACWVIRNTRTNARSIAALLTGPGTRDTLTCGNYMMDHASHISIT